MPQGLSGQLSEYPSHCVEQGLVYRPVCCNRAEQGSHGLSRGIRNGTRSYSTSRRIRRVSVVSWIEDTLQKYRMEDALEGFQLRQVISSHGPKAQDSEAGDFPPLSEAKQDKDKKKRRS